MGSRPLIVMMMGMLLSGCGALHAEEALVKEAQHQREAAYVRLAKAITRYCAVSTHTIESRDACILKQRLSSLQNGRTP